MGQGLEEGLYGWEESCRLALPLSGYMGAVCNPVKPTFEFGALNLTD